MKRFNVLKVLDRFSGLFEKAGVDYRVMRKILELKFLMDSRRAPSVTGVQNKDALGKSGNKFLKSLWIYALMGIILIPMVLLGTNYLFQMSAAMGIIMFMVMTSLISDFSSVLLDLRDRTIILTRPVEGRTLTAAKTLHVLGYMMMITGALTGPSVMAGFIRHGVGFGLLYLWMIFWMDLLIVVLTALMYLLILRFYDGEKLRDIVNYVQIALSMGMAIGYQFVGRMFDIINLEIVFKPAWWQFFLPPAWFGAVFEVILSGKREPAYLIMAAMAITVPVLAIVLYARNMAVFEQSLQKLELRGTKGKVGSELRHKISGWICRDPREDVFFRFAMNMMRNERDFKLRVYPSLGFSLIFPFIFMLNLLRAGDWQTVLDSRAYLFIYFSALMLPTAIMMMKYSAGYKGAWIYNATPITEKVTIYKGTLKAFLIRLLAPVFLFECLIFVVIFGLDILPDMALAFSNAMLYALICFMLFKKRLPFSEPFEAAQNADSKSVIPMMLILGGIGGIHYLVGTRPLGIAMLLFVSLAANVFLWRVGLKAHLEKTKPDVDLARYEAAAAGTIGESGGSRLSAGSGLTRLKWKNRK